MILKIIKIISFTDLHFYISKCRKCHVNWKKNKQQPNWLLHLHDCKNVLSVSLSCVVNIWTKVKFGES